MFEHPLVQIAGETNVQSACETAHYVYGIAWPLSGGHVVIGMLRLQFLFGSRITRSA